MYIILSQRIVTESEYKDELFKVYHYPAKYKNQIHTGDTFVYYQGDRFVKEHRYYYGKGIVGEIHTDDGMNFYAKLINCSVFEKKVPIYLSENGYVEQKGYKTVRKSINPPWQSSVRPLSQEAYEYILKNARILNDIKPSKNIDELKNLLKKSIKEFYIGGNISAIKDVVELSQIIAELLINNEDYTYSHNLDLNKNILQTNGMISQNEFVRMVSVQNETISRYINEGKIIPDRVIETGCKNFNFFYEDTVKSYAKKYNWDIITSANMMEKFMDMVEKMDMSYSYKPVLMYAMLENANEKGRVLVEDLIDYFINFYKNRRKKDLIVEKKKCLYLRGDYTRNDVMRNIFSNPFKRFEDMGFMKRSKDLEYVEFNKNIWNKMTKEKINLIISYCDNALKRYYNE